jgi:hypothetical protein
LEDLDVKNRGERGKYGNKNLVMIWVGGKKIAFLRVGKNRVLNFGADNIVANGAHLTRRCGKKNITLFAEMGRDCGAEEVGNEVRGRLSGFVLKAGANLITN